MNEPHETVYFTDRDLGHQFPAMLRAAGLRVERHDDHFDQLTPDSEWIAEIGRRGWVAVTRDKRIRYTPLALETLMTSGARLFVIVGRFTNEEAAETFVRQSKKAENLLRKESKPFIAKIRRDAVEVWLRERQWRSR
jgi:hypothetical protein